MFSIFMAACFLLKLIRSSKRYALNLGVYLDNNVRWEEHTQSIVNRMIMARSNISKTRHLVPLPVLRNTYFVATFYCQVGLVKQYLKS